MQTIQLPDVNSLSTLSTFDRDGNSHLLAGFWKEQRAALVFVRHFG